MELEEEVKVNYMLRTMVLLHNSMHLMVAITAMCCSGFAISEHLRTEAISYTCGPSLRGAIVAL